MLVQHMKLLLQSRRKKKFLIHLILNISSDQSGMYTIFQDVFNDKNNLHRV